MDEHRGRASRPSGAWREALVALVPLLLVALAADARAADPAGRLISSVGTVRAINADGAERALARGEPVYPGDTLSLGERTHAQLRMRDDALIELEAGARFAIPQYTESGSGGNVIMRLLRGAMRTITGAIGDGPGDRYRVETAVATIGVRGTQYALHLCDEDCAREDRAEGLYGRVDAGTVSASNKAGSRVFDRSEYFYIAAADVAPRTIVRPPEGILDGGAVSGNGLGSTPVADTDDVKAPVSDTVDAVDGTTEVLGDTVEGGAELLGGTIEGTTDVLGDTVSGTTDLAGDALGGESDLGATLDDAGGLAGDTLDATGDLAGDTIEQTGDVADETLNDATDALTDTVDDTTDLLE